MMDILEDLLGPLNILQQIQAYAAFAFAPVGKRRQKHSRVDLVQYELPRSDKPGGEHVPPLLTVIAHLKTYGVLAEYSAFDSRFVYFKVRKNQSVWALRLLDFDANGIPRLWTPKSGWTIPKTEVQSTKRDKPKGFLEQLFGL